MIRALLDLLNLIDKSARRRTVRPDVESLETRVVPTLLGQQIFPVNYPWNQNIANAPVAADSAQIISHIGSNIGIHPDWGNDNPKNGSSPLYGIPFNVVHGNTTTAINVKIDNYPGESNIIPVPIPANAVIEGDYQGGPNPHGGGYNSGQRGDSHLIVWDEDNNVAYELYGATRPSDPKLFPNRNGVELLHTDGLWHAAQETVWNMRINQFRKLGNTSADAAGLSILAGLVRPDEGLPTANGGQGAIDHALRFTLPSGDVNPQYIYPASHVVSESQGAGKLPFGARLRLENTAAVNSLISAMGPEAQIIAHAMQQYGLMLADIGSSMYVTGTSASEDANNNIQFTWNMNDVLGLRSLTAGDFQVVDLTPVVTGLSTSTGPAGTTVTILGQNFSGAAGHLKVLFGTTAASFKLVDDGHITAAAPKATGTVNVQVQSGVIETDPNNPADNVNNPIFGYGISAASSADQFTYTPTLVVSGFPSPVTAGTSGTLTVQVEDAFGQLVTGYRGTVALSSSDKRASLPGSYVFTAADAGQHTFSATLVTAAKQVITATDTVNSVIAGKQTGIVVVAAASAKVRIVAPASVTAGQAFTITVSVIDVFGNVTTGYTGTVHFTTNDTGVGVILPADYTFTSADAGKHVFTNGVTLATAGVRSIRAMDTVASALAGSTSVTVNAPGPAIWLLDDERRRWIV
jgi:hypothetical protein